MSMPTCGKWALARFLLLEGVLGSELFKAGDDVSQGF